jgi:hypothetical protein
MAEGTGGEPRFTDQTKAPKIAAKIATSSPNEYFSFGGSGGLSGNRCTF